MSQEVAPLNLQHVRSHFPALEGPWVFFDNAGGSQTLSAVGDRVRDYLLTTNVQLGASYEVSQESTRRVSEAVSALARFVNARDDTEMIVGSSTTALLRMLANAYGSTLAPGDEIVVTNVDHEANIGAWMDLEERGIALRTWELNRDTMRLETSDLESLLTDRTRLVTATHASNVLGEVHPVREWADLVHSRGAHLCIDGVAFAPHRAVDVQDLDVDFYVMSLYKVYGPHVGLMCARRELLEQLPGCNHFFLEDEIPYKFQPGNLNYELTWGAGAIPEYLAAMGAEPGDPADPRPAIERAFRNFAAHEADLSRRFLSFLATKGAVRVVGQAKATAERVPTISFVAEGRDSSEIPEVVDRANLGIRYGDFYAKRLIRFLDLERVGGVVRVSMVHYNTVAEVDRLIEALDPLL